MGEYDFDARSEKEYQEWWYDIEHQPVTDKKDAAAEFHDMCIFHPGRFTEHVSWILKGTYGRGVFYHAWKTAKEFEPGSMVRRAWFFKEVASWCCMTPAYYAAKVWASLTPEQKETINRFIDEAIDAEIEERAWQEQREDERREHLRRFKKEMSLDRLSKREIANNTKHFRWQVCLKYPDDVAEVFGLILSGAMGQGAYIAAWDRVESDTTDEDRVSYLLWIAAALNWYARVPRLGKEQYKRLFDVCLPVIKEAITGKMAEERAQLAQTQESEK